MAIPVSTPPRNLDAWRMTLEPDERELAQFVETLDPVAAVEYLAVEIVRTRAAATNSAKRTMLYVFGGSAAGHTGFLALSSPVLQAFIKQLAFALFVFFGGHPA